MPPATIRRDRICAVPATPAAQVNARRRDSSSAVAVCCPLENVNSMPVIRKYQSHRAANQAAIDMRGIAK